MLTADRKHLPLDGCAIAVSTLSLALLLSPYLGVALFGQFLAIWLGPVCLVIAVGATVVGSRSTRTRPVAAFTAALLALPVVSYGVLLAYSAGLRIPLLFQNMAIGWPQLIFFGSTLWTTSQDSRPVLPQAWAGVITVAFWACVAVAFARLSRRWASFWVLIVMATITIISTSLVVRAVLPIFRWRLLLEGP